MLSVAAVQTHRIQQQHIHQTLLNSFIATTPRKRSKGFKDLLRICEGNAIFISPGSGGNGETSTLTSGQSFFVQKEGIAVVRYSVMFTNGDVESNLLSNIFANPTTTTTTTTATAADDD